MTGSVLANADVSISLLPPFPVIVIIVLCVMRRNRVEREAELEAPQARAGEVRLKPQVREDEMERRFVLHAQTIGIAVVACLGAWALTGHHYFWPGWVALGGLTTVALHARSAFRPSST